MILNDPSSYLPKIYLMHMFSSPKNKCLKFSGRGIMVTPDTDVVKIIQRKILFIRAKENVPTDKMTLIKECGMGIHTKDTTDDVVKGLFETLMTH
ncbi:MAG: hypothetical protein KAJ29_08135 [Alphaproteobacteria bacterium]|nr:hypothetical protein [Alphaproteobacteria bacterium]